MNYYGRILIPPLITAAEAGRVIKRALAGMYAEGRFLGGYAAAVDGFAYSDTNDGTFVSFTGHERIRRGDTDVYVLDYHGGMIRP